MSSTGEILRDTRISKNLTLSQVKKATHIREHVLIALENSDFGVFHSKAQLRGFISHYAEFLGIDPTPLLEEFLTQRTDATLVTSTVVDANQGGTDSDGPHPIGDNDPVQAEDHRAIYREISRIFSERRKALDLTLEEVEHYSHIRKRNVEMIEKGDLDAFGSSVQLKGLISTYTDFLELDREKMLTLFAEALLVKRKHQHAPPERLVNAALPFELPLWARQLFSMDLVFGLSMLLIILVMAVWGGFTIINRSNAKATENPSISDVLLDQPTPVDINEILLTSAPVEELVSPILVEEATATAFPTTENLSPVNITIIVLEKALLKVTVDGVEELNTRTIPGSVLEFHGKESIVLLTGSASSIKVIYNQRDLGLLGEYGQSMIRIFGPSIEITATPSITPTPTITLRPSVTPIITKTPAP